MNPAWRAYLRMKMREHLRQAVLNDQRAAVEEAAKGRERVEAEREHQRQ